MSLTSHGRQWFAIQVKAGREDYAGEQFKRQGLVVYLPKTLQRCHHAGSVSCQARPLFPGYLFLHLAREEQRWTTIRSTYAAIGAVRFGSFYPPVPDNLIDALRTFEDSVGLVDPQGKALFRPGDRLRVNSGPMADIEGIYQCMKGKERVVLLMNLLGRQSRVELPLDLVA